MVTKADLFNFAKTLARNFVLPALAKSAIYAVLVGIIFFIAGLLVYNFGIGVPFQESNIVIRLLIVILTVTIYTALGVLVGLTLGATSAIGNKLGEAEQGVHQMLGPIMGGIIERVPVGQEGVSIEQFKQIVDMRIGSFTKESEPRSGIFSIASIAARYILRKLLATSRTILVVNFAQDLQARGETRVNTHSIEQFAREKAIRLVTNDVRLKLSAVRKIAVTVSAICLLIPALLIGLT